MAIERMKACVSAAVVFVINALALYGETIADDLATQITTGAVALAAVIYGIWKNHNFTDAAVAGQKEVIAAKSASELDEIDTEVA